MAYDGSGNWYPQLPDPPAITFTPGVGAGSDAHIDGIGSPVGVRTPDFEGQQYLDITNAPGICPLWQAIGPTNADWQQIT